MNRDADSVELRALGAEQANALVEGRRLRDWHRDYPTGGDVVLARRWLEATWDPAPQQVMHEGLVVGGIGTRGPVDEDGWVEVGFGLVDPERGHGVGAVALRLLLDELTGWGVRRVLADTAPDNGPCQRMLIRAGFTVLGENADEVLFSRRL